MKKSLIFLVMGLVCLVARAIPANPTPVKVTQPDGTTLTITLHGDEFHHFTTTLDGYTVVRNGKGFYTYAKVEGDQLVPTSIIAHDAPQRSAAERASLNPVTKMLTSPKQVSEGQQFKGRRNQAMRRVGADGYMDYDNFRGLIILINYTDKQFSMLDPNGFYDAMVNTHNFTGYTQDDGKFVSMTGSVRDYYYDNSNHIFDPSFDIVGPVNVNYRCTYPQGTNQASPIFHAALAAVDADINFNDYDLDHDGYVDMVFFMVAGFSSSYGGNNDNYLWPHMYYLYNAPMRDGVRFGLYACSTEISGWEGYGPRYYDIDGIGTICHEFSHVLGLPDLYDTDYRESGGESRNPGHWSIMAGGHGEDFGRNPVGYSLYERYSLGFTQPQLITEDTQITLSPLDTSNSGYRLNTHNPNEFFLIENRQSGKWDRFLPGYGMLIARVDSTDENVWWSNNVNCDPDHMYYELLRADYKGYDGPYDPFPGSSNVTSITNRTTPNLRTWDQNLNDIIFTDITVSNKLVSFNAMRDTTIISIIEDFEVMPESSDLYVTDVAGTFCNWTFSKSAVVAPAPDQCIGTHAVAMKKPSSITMTAPLKIKPYAVNFKVFNPTTQDAKVRVYYSFDKGENWMMTVNADLVAPAKSQGTAFISLPTEAPIMLRFAQIAGKDKSNIYLDDIKLYYDDEWQLHVDGDVNLDGELSIADVNAAISLVLDGQQLPEGDVNGDGEVNIADVNMIIDLLMR